MSLWYSKKEKFFKKSRILIENEIYSYINGFLHAGTIQYSLARNLIN